MNQISCTIVDNVSIITEYDENGNMISQKFRLIDNNIPKQEIKEEKSPLTRIWNWCKDHLYVKTRDLADPFVDRDDYDKGSDGKNSIEIGIKGTF